MPTVFVNIANGDGESEARMNDAVGRAPDSVEQFNFPRPHAGMTHVVRGKFTCDAEEVDELIAKLTPLGGVEYIA